MTIEEQLKNLILRRYNTMAEFATKIEIPSSTLYTIFKRGIHNSSVGNIIKICKGLGISADALADGEIAPAEKRSNEPFRIYVQAEDILAETKDQLSNHGIITLDGEVIGREGVDTLIDAINVGVEMVKKKR